MYYVLYYDLSMSYKSSCIIIKNIDLIRKKKADQIQDNGESIIYKRKPEILEQNKIPSNVPNVQLIEQPKQFGKKIHEKSLYTEKQGDQIQDNGENIIYKRKPEILEPNKIPPNVPNVQLIELKQFGEKFHEKSLHTEKQDDQIQDNGENILHKRKPEILEQNKIPSNVPNVQLIELKHFGEKIHEKTLNTEKHGELPEIDTDNSSDEEEVRTKHQQQRKDWEQSPELKAALIRQASIDPETIFGKISPLNVDEIFRGREYRIRPRSSSANWSGLDALTEEEELEYKIRMGFL
ncbi:hypothetical protein C1645_436609 [Glomus cerebriforme]|uniref:Inner centromere protein ARK-binding domain-containing protein n=1 Tax=Glomus cerebriforme TaxID=658196 RepID=A0A397SMI9_9GLOM|nr:hypothetical protein C1645_436609 [Glomus cerebriforme]